MLNCSLHIDTVRQNMIKTYFFQWANRQRKEVLSCLQKAGEI